MRSRRVVIGSGRARHRKHEDARVRPKYVVPPLAAAAALVLLVSEPTAEATRVLTISPFLGPLQNAICQPTDCTSVAFTPLPELNVINLDDSIHSSADPAVVVAYSQSSIAAEQWLREHAGDPDAPSPSTLSFVLIGNPSRAYGGNPLLGGGVPPSQYQVMDIVREYDIVADAPTDPYNMLAAANAMAGFFFLHLDTAVDVNDPNNVVWKVGNTTYVMVPTKNLPLLDPLRALGMSELADQLNGPLKAIVDQAYDRSVPAGAEVVPPVSPVATSVTSVAKESPNSLAFKTAAVPQESVPSLLAAPTPTPALASHPSDLTTTAGSSSDLDVAEPGSESSSPTATAGTTSVVESQTAHGESPTTGNDVSGQIGGKGATTTTAGGGSVEAVTPAGGRPTSASEHVSTVAGRSVSGSHSNGSLTSAGSAASESVAGAPASAGHTGPSQSAGS